MVVAKGVIIYSGGLSVLTVHADGYGGRVSKKGI